jgi:hypothetical protein
MHTESTIDPIGSPVPGIIPEPARVEREPDAGTEPEASPRHRNPARSALAWLASTLRGDKYMMNAYPPKWRSPSMAHHDDADEPVLGAGAGRR